MAPSRRFRSPASSADPAVEQPSDAQRAAVRRAVRRLEAGGHVEVHRLRVGRTYTQKRALPRHWTAAPGEPWAAVQNGAVAAAS
ncbi:hypothetical protein AB5J72_50880 [Streptomyces sp. CG1]|uniref:hypothetical protein n=1 Tax=Streptomyces sp. CG1 TaxID=1287523 RepID=UPI0034E2B05F